MVLFCYLYTETNTLVHDRVSLQGMMMSSSLWAFVLHRGGTLHTQASHTVVVGLSWNLQSVFMFVYIYTLICMSGYLVTTFNYCALPHCQLKTSPECHFFRYNQTKGHRIITCCVSMFQSGLIIISAVSLCSSLLSLSLETLTFNLSTTLFCVDSF